MNEIKYSDKLVNLGTETAFAVSGDANEHAHKGNRVFPFHLGDINICTPQNIIEATKETTKNAKDGLDKKINP